MKLCLYYAIRFGMEKLIKKEKFLSAKKEVFTQSQSEIEWDVLVEKRAFAL